MTRGLGDPATGDLVVEGVSIADGEPTRITIRDGRIARLELIERGDDGPPLPWVGPGWLDIQVNGFEGHDPNAADAQPDATAAMIRALWRFGVTGVCVTICTESEKHIVQALAAIDAACDLDPLIEASVVGIHVEGPHIATEDGPRGAHPLRHVRPPDIAEYRRWQEAAGGRIRIITLSPEYAEAVPYIEAIVADGVVASIGHTAANSDQIRRAVDAGATWSTHLGNGAHATLRRHPNYIWDQLADDRLTAGFILDGEHLPPAVMKSVIRAKGVERSILVSDALFVAGLPPGVYHLPDGAAVELRPSGRLELQGTPYLAGAAAALPVSIGNALRHADVGLADAIRMVTANPSRLLGLPSSMGHEMLQVGADANVTTFRMAPDGFDLEILQTFVQGRLVHRLGA
ncbi:MAG TPA: N-acetylglucosamine-6-phosphate deacetylase [Patescibacteria group bacterium]|nr:N-acetylglucosamine-6-phosphate deacetylase [Patescibacteria group bacterium]